MERAGALCTFLLENFGTTFGLKLLFRISSTGTNFAGDYQFALRYLHLYKLTTSTVIFILNIYYKVTV
jgi:hypothetical protein